MLNNALLRTTYSSLVDVASSVEVRIAQFHGQSGVDEYHLMVRPTEYANIATQWTWVLDAYRDACASLGLDAGTGVLQRFFCSDLPNQASLLEARPAAMDGSCAQSWVCQPPLPPAKIALWAYHVRLPEGEALSRRREGDTLAVHRGELTHLWSTGLTSPEGDTSFTQADTILARYDDALRAQGLQMAEHVLRTWFFVQNVDANYQGLVTARKDFFAARGLTPETHYIASTGIEGTTANVHAMVMLDAYAIAGVRPEQIRYIAAPEYLCPTHCYGVTFERGTAVAYQDRAHVFISGTASIDRTGAIVHPGDVCKQLTHTLENVRALLRQADADLEDVCMYIVYVRDPSDLDIARRMMAEHCEGAPVQIVHAPVCRPGWLIEVECLAIVPVVNPKLPAF